MISLTVETRSLSLKRQRQREKILRLCIGRVSSIRTIKAFGRNPEHLARFCEEIQQNTGTEVLPAEHPREVVQGSQVVVTITTAIDPLFDGRWLKPGVHINAIGSHRLQAREIDGETIARSDIIAVDSLDVARRESGDLATAEREGKFQWEQAVEMGDIVVGKHPGRRTRDQITLFKAHGIAMWDVAAAGLVFAKAVTEGIGQSISL